MAWEKAIFDAKLARIQADRGAEADVNLEFYKSIFAVAQGAVDRTRAGAATVQTAAAAVGTLYATLLGVVFSVTNNPLPSRGVIPVLFLGAAIVTSTAYLAYLTRAAPVSLLLPRPSSFERNLERARSLIVWTKRASEHNAYLLRVSVVALGLGIAFLPAAFVSFGGAPPAPAAAPTPDWPKPSPSAGSNPALQRVVYQAQVAEAAAERNTSQARPSNTGGNQSWWIAAAVAAGLMLLLPWIIDRLFGRAQGD